jgi:hypothetical protein
MESSNVVKPVRLPPGRARLVGMTAAGREW